MHKNETKKLKLDKTVVTKLQQTMTEEQLKAVVGGMGGTSRTNETC